MRSNKICLLAAVFTLPYLACSNPPEPPGPDVSSGGTGNATGKGGTAGSVAAGATAGTVASGGSGGSVAAGGTAGSVAAGGTAGTAGTGGTGGTPPAGDVLGHPGAGPYPEYPGFTLKLVEEFDAPIDFTSDPIWTFSDGGLPEGRVRFKQDGIKFEGGVMKLEARTEFTASSLSYAENTGAGQHYGDIKDFPLVSGEFRTKYNMFRYGRYEVNMKAPVVNDAMANGNFISTMFIFRTPKFQNWREIDIEVTGESADSIWTNVIYCDGCEGYDGSKAFATKTFPYGGGDSMAQPAGIDARTQFHTYAFEWTPGQVKWFIDGVQVRFKESGVGDNAVIVPDLPAKIMMNLWIFDGTGFGGPDLPNNMYPMHSEYEWFRFYQMDGEPYPCVDLTCLTPEDMDESKNNPDDGVPDSRL